MAITRRSFIATGAGLTFAFAVGRGPRGRVSAVFAQGAGFSPNVWVTIGADGTITIVSPAAEMGQGGMTALPVLIAEELDADWTKVKIVGPGTNNKAYGNPGFGGLLVTAASRTTPAYYMPLRIAGAQARRVLLDAVAERWGVPVSELTTEPSTVVHAGSKRKISYGEIATFATAPAELPKIVPADLKKASQFRLIGKKLPRVELPSKIDGSAKFGIDADVPDMLYATVLRAPAQGSGPASLDDAAAKAVAGVTAVIPLPYGVGVVATSYPAAQKGKAALKVTWKTGVPAEAYSTDKVAADYESIARDLGRTGLPAHKDGALMAEMASAAKIYEAVFMTEHVYHATMEPMNALAGVSPTGDTAEIWVGTQSPNLTQFAAAGVLKTTPDKITVHNMMLGGGFGRRVEQDFVVDAVLLSKATGKPVKVIWSREDDVRHDKYRPLTAQLLRAAVDKDGTITAWRHRLVAPSFYGRTNPRALEAAKGIDTPVTEGMEISYAIRAQLMEYFREERGQDTGVWRAVGSGYTKFASESFLDEIARKQNVDPVAFRLKMLKDNARATKVIETVTAMAEWKRPRKNGRAVGFAFSDAWKSYLASVVEVSVDRKTGKIRVHEVWSAFDCGVAILPDNIAAQLEGSAIFGVSHALGERITFKNGVVEQSNFHDYPILRMADAPDVHVKVIGTDHPPGGVGEAGLPPIAPAIGNAVAVLTGARLRHLPMLSERVLAAMKG